MKVLSLEQMHQLKELGVDVEPNGLDFMYSPVVTDEYRLMYAESVCEDDMKAFNLQDVIELLPAEIQTNDSNYYLVITKIAKDSYISAYDIDLQDGSMNEVQFFSNDVLDAAYQMLIWVIENGHLKTK